VNAIVRFARSKEILCQGRGSAANSAVCYVLGITSIDPARNDLLFERFVSEERREPPDIDVDFEHERREIVMQWVCAVERRRFPVGARPTRQSLQPEATGAAMEVTK
jgi:DNA polymerase III alpha subunit